MCALVFHADPGEVEKILATYAETLGYRRLELREDRLAWLHRRLSWRYPSTEWALRNWRVYSVYPGADGYTSVVMRHLKPRKGGSYSEEAAEVSRCAENDVYHVWEDGGEVFGKEKYRAGKLEKSIETYAGGPGALIDGKHTRSAEEQQEALSAFPPLSGHHLYSFSLRFRGPWQMARPSRDLIFVAGEVAEQLNHGEPLDDVSLRERLVTNLLGVVVVTMALPVALSIAIVVFLLCSPLLLFGILHKPRHKGQQGPRRA